MINAFRFTKIDVCIVLFIALFAVLPVEGQSNSNAERALLYKNLPFSMPEVLQPSFPSLRVSVMEFGAKGDGVFSNTKSFAAAIAAVVNKGGGTVIIPAGLWLTGPIELKSNVNLCTEKGAIVLFTRNFDEYPMVQTLYEGQSCWRTMSPIYAKDAENIAITGEGTFNGNGDAWRPVKKGNVTEGLWRKFVARGGVLTKQETSWYPTEGAYQGSILKTAPGDRTEKESEAIKVFLRPVMVGFIHCKKVLLDGVTFQNSPAWCLHPLMCENITVSNVKVDNEEWAANGDAIDLESCKNALIYNSIFNAGDDAICMKSGKDEEGRKRGLSTENVIIANCTVYHGHGGFVVGSEMSGGIRNILVRDCNFIGTDNGLRFKSTRGRGGVVENIYISNINMVNIDRDAILYDLYYAVTDKSNTNIPSADESTPQFKNIYMKNIFCKGADRAILFQGLPEMSLKNIQLENAVIEARTGVYFSDAESILMKNVQVYTKELPVMNIQNSNNLAIDNFKCNEGMEGLFKVSGEKTGELLFSNTNVKTLNFNMGAEVKPSAIIIR
jgi:polygalacturonase